MMRLFYRLSLALISVSIAACGPLLTLGGAPPQAPSAIVNISRGAVDFALNSFDAALYGLDYKMDAGKLIPGSPEAKRIAAAGRKVMSALGGLEALRDAANAVSYDAAWQKANEALREFRALIGNTPTAELQQPPGLQPTPEMRATILDRADALDASRKGDAA